MGATKVSPSPPVVPGMPPKAFPSILRPPCTCGGRAKADLEHGSAARDCVTHLFTVVLLVLTVPKETDFSIFLIQKFSEAASGHTWQTLTQHNLGI